MNNRKKCLQQNYTYCQFLRALSDLVLQNREQNVWLEHAASTVGNCLVISDAVVKARIHTGFHRFILVLLIITTKTLSMLKSIDEIIRQFKGLHPEELANILSE